MMTARFEQEFTFIQERHPVHLHLDKRDTVFETLRHNDSRIACRAGLTSGDCLACAAQSLSCHSGSQINIRLSDSVVDIDCRSFGNLSFEVFALNESDCDFTHYVSELKADRVG